MILSQGVKMQVKILGNQAPFQLDGKKGVGYLVKTQNCNIMLDAGSGSHSNLQVSDYENLNVIISHGHFDHVVDIKNIVLAVFTLRINKVIEPKVSIYLPYEFENELEETMMRGKKVTDTVEIFRYNADSKLKFGETEICFLKTTHSIDSYAIKISGSGSTLGYTGDVGVDDVDMCAEFFHKVDVILADCSIPQNHPTLLKKHLRPHDCARLKDLSKAKSIYLTHLYAMEYEESYLNSCKEKTDNCFIAHEGLVFNIDK